MRPRKEEKSFVDLYGDPYLTKVPERQYQVAYLGCERGSPHGKKRIFAWFQINEEGPHHGKPIVRFYNAPTREWIPRSHNLYLDFTVLTGLRPPTRFTPDDYLKGTEVLAEVVTVHERIQGRRRIEIPEALHYSKIERLLKYTAGSPPCTRSGKKKQ